MTRLLLSTALLSCCAAGCVAQIPSLDLSQSTMEELTRMEISISSVSRKEENLFHAPAAAYVITREDIAHSTASNIPDLLRFVPGLQVAQLNASTWAVSARGFNSVFANKLLVLIDGRTVYSEIYSGEHWDEIDLPLDEVERIEVIRGPGAVVWGTNAVNGVINIITRAARAVSSPAVAGSVSRTDNQALVQQGGTLGNSTQFHGYFSYIDRRSLDTADGSRAFDGTQIYRVGGRVDSRTDGGTRISALGGVYGGLLHQQIEPTVYAAVQAGLQEHDSILGGYGLLRVEHSQARNSYELQAYASNATRNELTAHAVTVTEDVDVVDHFHAGERLDLVSGGELRLTQDSTHAPTPFIQKPSYHNYLVDGFLQGEAVLVPGRLTAVVGSKIQDGTLAGFQLQPSARLAWTINTTQFLWAAVSRGVVAPALQEKFLSLDLLVGTANHLPVLGTLTGNPAFQPETVMATEAGYRKRLTRTLSLDLAGYLNNTHRLQSISAQTPTFVMSPSPAIRVPLLYGNAYTAKSQGVESSLDWKPSENFQVRANYSWIEAQVKDPRIGQDELIDGFNSPRNTFAGLARWRFAQPWTVEGSLYKVTAVVPAGGVNIGPAQQQASSASVAGFVRLDLAVERQVGSRLRLAAGGTNLSSARHLEVTGDTTFLTPFYVPRSLFLRAGWSF